SAPPDAVLAMGSSTAKNQNTFKHLPLHLLQDQKNFWTSPLRMRAGSALGTAAFGVTIGGLAAAGGDTSIEKHLPTSTSIIDKSRSFSDYAAAGFAGVAGAAYVVGKLSHNDHMVETGFLSGEAALNTFGMTEAAKYGFGRQRPLEGTGQGNFFSGGRSFSSEHAALAWSIGTVVAQEYPGWMTKMLAYGGAAGVSAARVTAREHFTSDVLVGSALGYVMGRQVYRVHSGETSELKQLGTFTHAPRENTGRNPANMGSPYVPLDSWVYPAFDRLIAMGYVRTGFLGLRPWTRMECARLIEEAKDDPESDVVRGYIE